MKILPVTLTKNSGYSSVNLSGISKNTNSDTRFELQKAYYTPIFTAKRLNVAQEKTKLIKLFDDILKKDSPQESIEDLVRKTADSVARFIKTKINNMRKIESQASVIADSKTLTDIQKYEMINALNRQYLRVQKSLPKDNSRKPDKDIENTDFLLINKLKTSVLNDKYNLHQVIKEHFHPISEMTCTDQLGSKYPMIKLPKTPEEVIAKKVVKTLPRSLFLKMDEYAENSDAEGLDEYIKSKISGILQNTLGSKSSKLTKEEYERLEEAIADAINDRYEYYAERDSIGSLPEKVKYKVPIATDEDIKLLSVDYDKYVLYVLSSIYHDLKKPADIVYKENGTVIKLSDLNDSAYKFDKFPEKIKQFIKTALEIQKAERMYEAYSDEEFKSRILFYTDKLGYKEEIFEKLVEFDSCRFTLEDKEQLKRLLRKLDLVFDNELSAEEALNHIEKEDLRPHGTAKMNENERKVVLQKLRTEQKNAAKLRSIQEDFDNAINTLYKNNMNYSAEIAAFYRPSSLMEDSEHYRFLINLIKKYSENGEIKNKATLNKEILFWNKYIESTIENSPALAQAENYAKDKTGKIDKIKAGKYLYNLDVVDTYNENKEYQNEIRNIIIKSGCKKDDIIKLLCKYDDYITLTEKNGVKISNATELFDQKIPVEKNILKYIIENDYINNDTTAKAVIKGNSCVETCITSKAKRELYEYYRFPKCLTFFDLFEYAMTTFATTKASAGIKKLGKNNNSLANVYEIKIMGYDDRLICYDGSFRFDEFTPVGIH